MDPITASIAARLSDNLTEIELIAQELPAAEALEGRTFDDAWVRIHRVRAEAIALLHGIATRALCASSIH